jgi:NADPH:quinone reductase-like Zn-dependent oxidoreductase
VPGFEAAGVVDEIGDGVTGTAIGQEVFGAAPDGWLYILGGRHARHRPHRRP